MMHKETLKSHIGPISILLGFIFCLSLSTYFGYIFTGYYNHDAGIFAYIGYAMDNGRSLYTEAWENKGPLLYLINMVAISINYWHGLYFAEVASLIISAVFAYKTALLIVKNKKYLATSAVIFSMLLLTITLEGGNLSEEYALPFMCSALYWITKFFYNHLSLKRYEIIFIGMCFSAVFLLRANICAVFLAAIFVVIFALLKQRQWRHLLQISLFTVLGIVLFILPILIYLITNNALEKCISDAYVSIMSQIEPMPFMERLWNVFMMTAKTALTGTLFVAVIFIITYLICHIKKSLSEPSLKYILSIAFWGVIFNLMANSISGVQHMHYFMTFVPIMVIPTAWVFDIVYTFLKKPVLKKPRPKLIISSTIFLVLIFNSFILFNIWKLLNHSATVSPKEPDPVAAYILDHSCADDLVQVIGGDVTLNYKTQRLTASRHLHFGHGRFTQEAFETFANEIAEDIENNCPSLILFGSDQTYDSFRILATRFSIESFLQSHYEHPVELNYMGWNYIIYKSKRV